MTTMNGMPFPADAGIGQMAEPDRRSRIIDAADELLNEAGLEGLTIRAVLKRTGLARRAFYECFEGKDDLVLAVFERSLHSAAVYFRTIAQQLDDPLESIHVVLRALVLGPHEFEDEPGNVPAWTDRRSAALAREHLRLAESRPDELHAALKPLLDLIAAQVREGIGTGQFRECDPDLQARLIYNLVATTVHTVLLEEASGKSDREHRQELAVSIWEFCRRAIIT